MCDVVVYGISVLQQFHLTFFFKYSDTNSFLKKQKKNRITLQLELIKKAVVYYLNNPIKIDSK